MHGDEALLCRIMDWIIACSRNTNCSIFAEITFRFESFTLNLCFSLGCLHFLDINLGGFLSFLEGIINLAALLFFFIILPIYFNVIFDNVFNFYLLIWLFLIDKVLILDLYFLITVFFL